MMLLHPSSLGLIMTNGKMPAVPRVRKSTRKPKTPEGQTTLDAEHKAIDDAHEKAFMEAQTENSKLLSVGAQTYCKALAREFVYGYRPEIQAKAVQKGIDCESDSIALYNEVHFTSHIKNTERKSNEWLTGECDIDASDRIIDIKTSWSLETFPAFKEDCHSPLYEWQGRAYMLLWNKDLFELAFCMVSTPPELVGYESEAVHFVDHIDPQLRVTSITYERDKEKEELIKIKGEAAQKYITQAIEIIGNDHS